MYTTGNPLLLNPSTASLIVPILVTIDSPSPGVSSVNMLWMSTSTNAKRLSVISTNDFIGPIPSYTDSQKNHIYPPARIVRL